MMTFKLTLKQCSDNKEIPMPGREEDNIRNSCLKIPDQTHMIIHVFFLVSWALIHEKKKKKCFFYHGHDLMQIFKINQIIGFLVDYLQPVLLVYPGLP